MQVRNNDRVITRLQHTQFCSSVALKEG
jgi:hypothetical protein